MTTAYAELLSLRRNRYFPFKEDYPASLADCVVTRGKPWRLEIWEPLPTTAPKGAQPWCCYIQTVIFYTDPARHVDGRMDEIDRLETRLAWDDLVSFEGDDFEIGGGEVVWKDDRWWMKRWARRVTPDTVSLSRERAAE